MKIIFVCSGNTCRSPLAESIAKSLLPHDSIASRGLFAVEGQAISKESLELIHKYDLPEPSRAQTFHIDDLDADIILTMTQAHKDLIFSIYGRQSNVFTLNEYVGDTQEIDDPYGGSFDVYEQTYTKIYDLVDKIKFKHE